LHTSKKDTRRHDRIPYLAAVRISWEDAHGLRKYAQARCLDVSEDGLLIEVPEPIPVHSTVSLRAEAIKLAGSGTVKHVTRRGSKMVLGLELSHALRDQALALIRPTQPSDMVEAEARG
jgi:hypothetical protein